jgi:hypothetical protein
MIIGMMMTNTTIDTAIIAVSRPFEEIGLA